MISATQIYNSVQCLRRVFLDQDGDISERDEPNAFLELLWSHGVQHEAAMIQKLGFTVNLKETPLHQREQNTLEAMRRGERLIYGGRLTFGDLVGEPDLLELRNGKYIPGDIKSGGGFDGDETDGKYKKHYAVQLAHYVHILEELGFSDLSKESFVIDASGVRVLYELGQLKNQKTNDSWWDFYLDALANVRGVIQQTQTTRGALSSICKMCHWYTSCKKELIASDDLSLIAELGAAKRDVMFAYLPSVNALASCNPISFIVKNKTPFPGVGPDSLNKFYERAKLLKSTNPQPYLKGTVNFPIAQNEIFFDIEADPTRDFVYLHGFVERKHGQIGTEKFIPFFAEGIDSADEELVFKEAWDYIQSRIHDSVIYYYSKYERTAYRKLANKYSGVCSLDDVEDLFSNTFMIDLYFDVVKPLTEWPTYDQSIKTLAQYLGFKWRDKNPSGAASIEWFNSYIETNDLSIKKRILDYNEDDCLATGVLLDGIKKI